LIFEKMMASVSIDFVNKLIAFLLID
jgi:hypothetical protein